MPRVFVTVKSTLSEFAALDIIRAPVEPDLSWDDFFRFKEVTQFNNQVHVVSAKRHVAFGDDLIMNTASLFRREHFSVSIVRRDSIERNRAYARARGTRGRGRGRGRSSINVSSLIGHSTAENGAAAAAPGSSQRQHNQPRPRGRPARGRGGIHISGINRLQAHAQQPSTSNVGAPPVATSRGRGRGGRVAFSGFQRGSGRPANASNRQLPSANSVASAGTMDSLRAGPPTPRASENGPQPGPHRSSFPEEYIFPSTSHPQNNERQSVIYAESVDSALDDEELDQLPPVVGTRKEIFLQLAARAPSADFDVLYKEIQELKAKKKPGTNLPDEAFWRWSKRTPTTSHFLQMALRIQ